MRCNLLLSWILSDDLNNKREMQCLEIKYEYASSFLVLEH